MNCSVFLNKHLQVERVYNPLNYLIVLFRIAYADNAELKNIVRIKVLNNLKRGCTRI